jgi:hypothetical protein
VQSPQKTLVLGSLVAVAFGAASAFLFPLYATPLGALIVPFIVILILRAGWFCGALAIGLLALVGVGQADWMGAALVLLTVPGASVAIALLIKRRAAAYYATYYGAAAMTIGMIAFLTLYAMATGSDLASDILAGISAAMHGFFPAETPIPRMDTTWGDYVDNFVYIAGDSIKLQVLPQMIALSCLSALFGTTLPIIHMRKKGLANEVSQLGLLHTWRVPRKVSLTLTGTYVVSYFLSMTGVAGMLEVAQAVWNPVEILYGTALLSFLAQAMRRSAMGRRARAFLLTLSVLAMLFLASMGFLFALPIVVFGMAVEAKRSFSARVPGDTLGPFGPPDTPRPKGEQGDEDKHE